MKKFIALFSVVALIGMNCATYKKGKGINLEPGQKPGAVLIIQKINGQQIRGELIAVKRNSLLLKEAESGADWDVGVAEIKTVTIVKKSKLLEGGLIGLLLGGVIGFIIGYPQGDEDGFVFISKPLAGGIGAAIGGGAGALIGASIGSTVKGDKTIQIEGKSDSEIKWHLEKLRKKARVPDFQ
jgi:hypothetical protein